mgnify:FL=1
MVIEKFRWNDGGRSVGGFVGLTGDCVTRSIAIATGLAYRDVYQTLKNRYGSSPRGGVPRSIYHPYLTELGWISDGAPKITRPLTLFHGSAAISVLQVQSPFKRTSHLCTVSEGVLHDTWDPREEGVYQVTESWVPGPEAVINISLREGDERRSTGDMTQAEFEKIIQRLRAIDNTAKNQAATEGERENALRMMQSLMLRHNLTREDLGENSELDSMHYTRRGCAVNGSKALSWEKDLASYITDEIFPMTQWYSTRVGHRTLFFFYGPRLDVENTVQLFRELLLTIATAAKLLWGGYARGSGASYAEGYVASLPKTNAPPDALGKSPAKPHSGNKAKAASESDTQGGEFSSIAIVRKRTMIVHERSREWLELECGVKLATTWRRGRDFRDPAAETMGRIHGAQHRIDPPSGPKRLT